MNSTTDPCPLCGGNKTSGKTTYTGQTFLETGTLSVASLNSVVKGKASSCLGAPIDIETGEIVIGKEITDGECALIYTGTGETSDRVMNLAGKISTMTFDQSGSGLFKLTSDLWISGFGSNKKLSRWAWGNRMVGVEVFMTGKHIMHDVT